jgi:hypothetical protein
MRNQKRVVKTRRIGGRVYRRYRAYGSRYDARAIRDNLIKKGRSVRIIEGSGVPNPYVIYIH